MTQVFLHIYPIIVDVNERGSCRSMCVTPELSVSIYRVEESANYAQDRLGGMVVETTADKLKGRVDVSISATEMDDELEQMDGKEEDVKNFPNELPDAHLVCGYDADGDIPHTVIRDKKTGDTKAWKFSKDGNTWLKAFFEESGAEWGGM